MQLTKIKMSGFKSFIDPTTILLPSNLVAVVGPNGCGKSNVIDAVTWVMGESSPKYLRGEALTDVIFNGSTARKPVGQATVELIFDNSDGSLGGEYASYAEISVKRMINREADAGYYLNGVRCRKKDIVTLFLGTGLGPRSYSIIGQNMISRIAEAKPDELRTYLEEAAGISKYKERRHETELRIQHTKDNLARVNDVRAELEKQLSHLKYQARVAEKYQSLKEQERKLRAESCAIQWQQLNQLLSEHGLQLQEQQTLFEARQSDLVKTDLEIENLRGNQREVNAVFQEVQHQYYATGNEITRIEQAILHHKEKEQQWQSDLVAVEKDCEDCENELAELDDQAASLAEDIAELEPQMFAANKKLDSFKQACDAEEQQAHKLQNVWDTFQQKSAETSQRAQVEQTRIQHIEKNQLSLRAQQEKLQQDQKQIDYTTIEKEINAYEKNAEEATAQLNVQQQKLNSIKSQIQENQEALHKTGNQLDQTRNELQKLSGQKASLEALQEAALGQREHAAHPFIKQHQLEKLPRLAQLITVEKGWELAVEKVLGNHLQAICMDNADAIIPHLEDFSEGNLSVFISGSTSSSSSSKQKSMRLLDKIKSPWALDSLLSDIHVADTLESAIALCETLKQDESVITPEGIWLNRAWLKILRDENPAAGVFEREQTLKIIDKQIEQSRKTQSSDEAKIKEYKSIILKLEQQYEQQLALCHQQQANVAQITAQHHVSKQHLAEAHKRSQRLNEELEHCNQQLMQLTSELATAKSVWENALKEMEGFTDQREIKLKEREDARARLSSTRALFNQEKDNCHELEIRLQTSKSQLALLQQNKQRLQIQDKTLHERRQHLEKELANMTTLADLNQSLETILVQHREREHNMKVAREQVDQLDEAVKLGEEKRQGIEREINQIRNKLESLRVEGQGWKVKADSLYEQAKETECDLNEIIKTLAPEMTLENTQNQLDQVITRINRLGPINLVAIDEYKSCLERKEYLDTQIEDLQSGLATLEDAISKIDRETRAKFKETFEKVNEQFQTLFPTIFGGGKAWLEMNSENLLETGVTMMACPPGKRNSSIYLLSGGEKSLTAIAFIFSIFYLNPAPFCLLDEVDAALDDANVLRFTQLLKSMSGKTQFIFISHNKISIGIGEHLIGVTMNEPGVSRLVSVDVEKAMSMVENG